MQRLQSEGQGLYTSVLRRAGTSRPDAKSRVGRACHNNACQYFAMNGALLGITFNNIVNVISLLSN